MSAWIREYGDGSCSSAPYLCSKMGVLCAPDSQLSMAECMQENRGPDYFHTLANQASLRHRNAVGKICQGSHLLIKTNCCPVNIGRRGTSWALFPPLWTQTQEQHFVQTSNISVYMQTPLFIRPKGPTVECNTLKACKVKHQMKRVHFAPKCTIIKQRGMLKNELKCSWSKFWLSL